MPDERWQRVKDLFAGALAVDADERERFLAERCDGPLREEVRSLLASHEAAGQFIEPLRIVEATERGTGVPFEGRRIGPYQIVREIAQGGMGTVYLATRADGAFDKQVAVKVVRRGLDVEDILLRFRHERETLASLDHPNIARLLDAGSTEEGLPYYVMEYVAGQRVDVYCDERRLTVAERLELFRTVCAAVHCAHRNLIVHRDIKPDNVLVTSGGSPKLVDFGIAKVLEPARAMRTLTTGREQLLTPEYASPEQRLGSSITIETDVYSLGVLLHELLTGRRPQLHAARGRAATPPGAGEPVFEKPSALAVRECELSGPGGEKQSSAPEAMSLNRGTSPRGLQRQLQGDLDAIVAKATRWEPHRRYGSAEQLAEDIRRHLAGLPIHARHDAIAYRATKFVRRHAAGVAAAAMVVAALVAGVAGVAWEARRTAEERDRARIEADKAREVNAVLRDMLRAPDPQNSGRTVTVVDTLDRAAKRLDAGALSHPEVSSAIRRTLGVTYTSLGVYDAAETQLRAALAAMPAHAPAGRLERAAIESDLGDALSYRGERAAAEQLYRHALAEFDALGVRDSLSRADALNSLGETLRSRGDDREAESCYRQALDIRRRLLGEGDVAVAESLNNLAVVMHARNELVEAERLYRESLAILRAARGDDHPGVPATLGNLATVVGSRGDLAAAESLYREALAIRRRLLGNDHPEVTFTLYGYADTLEALGRYGEAAALSRDVLARRGRSLPERHPVVPASLLVLGKSLLGLGDHRGAETALREALALRRQLLPAGHWQVYSAQTALGRCLTAQRRFAEAEGLLLEAYERLNADRGPQHERTIDALANVVQLYEAWNRPDKVSLYRSRQLPGT